MEAFHFILNIPSNDYSETEIKLFSCVCQVLNLYLEKYDEEYSSFIGPLTEDIWNILLKCNSSNSKFDPIFINAIHYLKTILTTSSHHMIIKNENTLNQICERIIIPNIFIRDEEIDMFESDPDGFISLDIDGGDNMKTRRGSIHELIKGLLKYFEKETSEIFIHHITLMFTQLKQNDKDKIRIKDACIQLVTAITAKNSTSAFGAVEINQFINVIEFFNSYVLPEISSSNSPILIASALKFTTIFRNQLIDVIGPNILVTCSICLKNENEVVHSYAANLIEKYLLIKNPDKTQKISKDILKSFSAQLIFELLSNIEKDEVEENDYVIKAIFRISKILQSDMLAHVEICLEKLKQVLYRICRNPRKPIFNHYLFETFACLIRYITEFEPSTSSSFEAILFESFQFILSNDIGDFIPYTIQIISLLLKMRPDPIPDFYLNLLPSFMNSKMYDRAGNVPALSELLRVYVYRLPNEIVKTNQFNGLMGVFQFLNSKKSYDHFGAQLLCDIFNYIPPENILSSLSVIFHILLLRLQNLTSVKFEQNLCLIFLTLCAKFGGNIFVETLEKIQTGLSSNVINHIIVKKMAQATTKQDKLVSIVGCTKLICDTPLMLSIQMNREVWPLLIREMIRLNSIDSGGDEPRDKETNLPEIINGITGEAGMTFNKLICASIEFPNPYNNITSHFFAENLCRFSKRNQGLVESLMRQKLDEAVFVGINRLLENFDLILE
eukprot:c15082_g1_i1.p1 GENE.c15082_g1_i1~~c15082_g1_i1.p1  ORF type:complete len:726 (+),score=188.34 c15082_g1_i1:67-2244(+)